MPAQPSTLATALLYAHDLSRLAAFYEAVLGLMPVAQGDSFRTYDAGGVEFTLHAIPPDIAATFSISRPPEVREEAALRLTFSVTSLDAVRALATAQGGELGAPLWESTGWRHANGFDVEGNVFQLREPLR